MYLCIYVSICVYRLPPSPPLHPLLRISGIVPSLPGTDGNTHALEAHLAGFKPDQEASELNKNKLEASEPNQVQRTHSIENTFYREHIL